MDIDLNLSGFEGNPRVIEHVVLDHSDPKAVNTSQQPDEVVPRTITPTDGTLQGLQAPVLSWNMVRIAL